MKFIIISLIIIYHYLSLFQSFSYSRFFHYFQWCFFENENKNNTSLISLHITVLSRCPWVDKTHLTTIAWTQLVPALWSPCAPGKAVHRWRGILVPMLPTWTERGCRLRPKHQTFVNSDVSDMPWGCFNFAWQQFPSVAAVSQKLLPYNIIAFQNILKLKLYNIIKYFTMFYNIKL